MLLLVLLLTTLKTLNFLTIFLLFKMTITEIKKLATEGKSPYFFSPDTMRFFSSKVYNHIKEVENGFLFITSEVFGDNPRHYQLRLISLDGSINYYGERFDSLKKARDFLNSSNCSLNIGYDPTFKRREHIKKKKMLDNIGEDRI